MHRSARQIRAALGRPLARVAAETGIDKAALSRFERGVQGLRLEALQRLAQYYACPTDALLQDAPEERPAAVRDAGSANDGGQDDPEGRPLAVREVSMTAYEAKRRGKRLEALLELQGLGQEIWDEKPDDYVRRLREPWYPDE